MQIDSKNCILIGLRAGASLLKGDNNLFLGNNAGSDLKECSDKIIIGDDILNLNHNKDCIVIMNRIYIGKYIFGELNPIYTFIKKTIKESEVCKQN